jgi:transposase InsO family protein
MKRKKYRRYDPRLRNLVAESDDMGQFRGLGIPKSTLRQWMLNGPRDFFTIPELSFSTTKLAQENLRLVSQLASAEARETLVTKTLRIFGFQIQYKRLPSSTSKGELLQAIKEAKEVLPLQACLSFIGLSAARYHHWLKREVRCLLRDRNSCPQVAPTGLTDHEVSAIRKLYTDKAFSHYSIQSLCWLAKKTGEVVASPSTWSRVVRQLGLKRNRVRIYPLRPRVGIRASKALQIWHLDLTIFRLQDGSRAFLQAILDNFSRYTLAWKVSRDYGGLRTKELLLEAIHKAKTLGLKMVPSVFVDSGTENVNEQVDQLVVGNLISRTIAQIDVEFSNSMIEMLFHRLKHRYLFTIPLTNFEALKKGADFYLTESNTRIPQTVLKGATPEEAITGTWNSEQIDRIQAKVIDARMKRIEFNQRLRCQPCLA